MCFCCSFVVFDRLGDFLLVGILLTRKFSACHSQLSNRGLCGYCYIHTIITPFTQLLLSNRGVLKISLLFYHKLH